MSERVFFESGEERTYSDFELLNPRIVYFYKKSVTFSTSRLFGISLSSLVGIAGALEQS